MINEGLKIKGWYELKCFRADGSLKWSDSVKNLVTDAGIAQLALLCGDATATPFTYIALGSSSTAVAGSDTALTSEIASGGLSRAAGTVSRVTTTLANDTYQVTKTFTASATLTIEELGIFNASSSGTLLSHALTGTKQVTSLDTLVVTYKLQFA